MNDFKRQKIRFRPVRKKLSKKVEHNLIAFVVIIIVLIFMYATVSNVIARLSDIKFFNILTDIIGSELTIDEHGHTNILLLGVGGEGHEGKDLTDTVVIVSIDYGEKHVSLLSIPRDLYVASSLGESRINRLYEKGTAKWGQSQGLDFARTTLETILDIPLHYAIKVDFEAFSKLVDSVGGIDVHVEDTINDLEYPRDGTYDYERFFLEKGLQHLDGVTALKFVRSRKTSSDFDRSKRQHAALLALKSKATSRNIFTKKGFLKDLYYSLQKHVVTNITIREMFSIADFAAEWNVQNFSTAILNDEPIFKGGFLYTPLRELYGGAYVLLPAGDSFESMRHFVKFTLYGPYKLGTTPLAILNGTKTPGLGAKVATILRRFGIEIMHIGNAAEQTRSTSTWFLGSEAAKPLAERLSALISGEIAANIFEIHRQNPEIAAAPLILEIGANAVPQIEKLDIFRNVVPLVPLQAQRATQLTPALKPGK